MPRVVVSAEHGEITYTKTAGDKNTDAELIARLKVKDDIKLCMLENPHKFLQDPARFLEYYNIKW